MKKVLVIDAQGGGIGRQIITGIREKMPDLDITAVGTNSAATSNMLKAGASRAATGENAVVVGCRTADIIIGPIGIAIADAMLGEVTARMAEAVGQSNAERILIPFQHCGSLIVGVNETNTGKLVAEAIGLLCRLVQEP
ncbi:MAG: DUF3842 family protein [Solobacterium sp.]|nr:DUF3842 family protein [Solobacterium sp.]